MLSKNRSLWNLLLQLLQIRRADPVIVWAWMTDMCYANYFSGQWPEVKHTPEGRTEHTGAYRTQRFSLSKYSTRSWYLTMSSAWYVLAMRRKLLWHSRTATPRRCPFSSLSTVTSSRWPYQNSDARVLETPALIVLV